MALDHHWRFTYINPAAAALLQYPAKDLMGQPLWGILSDVIRTDLKRCLKQAPSERPMQFEVQSPVTQCWYDISAAPTEDGMAVSLVDVTPRKEMEASLRRSNEGLEQRVRERTAELERLAYQDVLTSLPSRRAFDEAFEEATRRNRAFQLLLMDVDELKAVNDHAGHAQGDHLLQCFGKALQDAFRLHGRVYRLGGDEFTLLLTEQVIVTEEVRRTMEQVQRQMSLKGVVLRWNIPYRGGGPSGMGEVRSPAEGRPVVTIPPVRQAPMRGDLQFTPWPSAWCPYRLKGGALSREC